MGQSDILEIVNGYPISDRILLVEAILKKIREEEQLLSAAKTTEQDYSGESILEFAGILDKESAKEMKAAVEESRR
ncbi:MAG: hypothetical protein AAF798_21385 [Bacteroidota bacterium]